MTLQLGILLALGCAFATNLGFLYKHRGACAAPSVDMRHPLRSAAGLFGSKWFAIGMAVATFAWGLHVAALTLAPLSVVQAVLSGGIVLLAVMAERLFGYQVGPRQWIGVALTATGLILIGVTLPGSSGAHSSFSVPGMIAFEAVLLGLGALLIMNKRLGGPEEHHGVMLGAAAGVLFGVSDVAIKAITGLVGSAGFAGFVSPWMLIAIVASIAAFYASARGLQDGEAVPVMVHDGHRGEHLLHRRRHPRLRGPDARRRARHRRAGLRVRDGLCRLRAHAGTRAGCRPGARNGLTLVARVYQVAIPCALRPRC